MKKINADLCHDILVGETEQKLAFNPNVSLVEQRKVNREKLFELLGLNNIKLNACPQNVIIESEELKDGYKLIRFVYESEKNMLVPAYLLIPTTGKKSYPVAIVLQGHKKGGMYNSIGIVKNEEDEKYQPQGAFALQAVKNGFAALCIEMRGTNGELLPVKPLRGWDGDCNCNAVYALLLGRTSLGEKCWDISRAIDILPIFPELDTGAIVITGDNAGGTTAYYAACCDERITLCTPNNGFCPYKDSILETLHCFCSYVPGIYEWFEMHDLVTLIAPRKLVIISARGDTSMPFPAVEKCYETIKAIFEKSGKKDNCKLVLPRIGAEWREDIVWPEILEMFNK